MKDRASGKSRGFGFVTYWSAADAQRVLEGNHVVDGRRCEVRGRVLQSVHAQHRCCPARASAWAALGCAPLGRVASSNAIPRHHSVPVRSAFGLHYKTLWQ